MPRASKESTIARQWELLMLLPSRMPGRTARELCEALGKAGHEVSKRTVERDLLELAGIFPLLSNEVSKPFGWYWSRDVRLGIPGIDLAEAVTLGLLEEVLKSLVPPSFYRALDLRFSEAREKLASLPGNRHARWGDVVRYLPPGLPFIPAEVSPVILREIQDALLRPKPLLVEYLPPGQEKPKEITLHPLALIQQGVRMYLLATAFEYDQPGHYAIHRIESVVALAGECRVAEGFSLDAYLARGGGQFGGEGFIQLKARLSESLAQLLEETPLSEDQRVFVRAGNHYLTATVIDSWQLKFWILSQGPSIVVTHPAKLRRDLLAKIQSTVAAYGTNQPQNF